MAKARVYLFHGNDIRASQLELQRWSKHFEAKYGRITTYRIDADEQNADATSAQVQQALQSQSLFPEPAYVTLRRLSSAGSPTKIKDVLGVIGARLQHLPDDITLVLWEDKLLSATHPIKQWCTAQSEKGLVEIKEFTLPGTRTLMERVIKEAGVRLDTDAARWLEKWLQNSEKLQRIEAKLRAPDVIAQDRRGWELMHVLETAALLNPEQTVITADMLRKAVGLVELAVSPFEIVNALRDGSLSQALLKARQWEQDDESQYFGLMALLRQQLRRESGGTSGLARMRWLAEIELLSKNVPLRQAWLLDLFLLRAMQRAIGTQPLLVPKRLWLSHLQRSE